MDATRYDEVGCSPYTVEKQAAFESILRYHLSITLQVMPRWGQKAYHFWDLNAGPGLYLLNDGTPITGSPLIFLKVVTERQIPYRAYFIEKSEDCYNALLSNTASFGDVRIVQGDHNNMLRQCYGLSKDFGLVYTDPNDTSIPFDSLASFNRWSPMVEFLIHVAGTSIKRSRKRHNGIDLLSRISPLKKYWLIREPSTMQQWTFLLGSNWDGFKDWKRQGFYRADSAIGREIIERVNYTKDELDELYQPALPELQGISETPDLPSNQSEGD